MSRDGIEYLTFDGLCGNEGPTITLRKLKDANIIGNILLYNGIQKVNG